MKNELLNKLLISIGILLFSLTVFCLLQNEPVYNNTLRHISNNYKRIDGKQGSKIVEIHTPFEKITSANLYRWDAKLYKSISDSLYKNTDFHFKERLAFYPLFSLIWKATTIDSPLIFLVNYLLFAFSLGWILHLFRKNDKNSRFIFVLALLLPPSVVYYLPYAESLFLFTFVVALAGLVKKNYWLFFAGALAFSMTRPAALIFIFAIAFSDIRYFFKHRNIHYFLKEISLKILPFALGILLVMLIQFMYSGSWTAYFDSLTFWPAESGLTNKILDWSVEGFGMTVFAIFFLALPLLIYALYWGISALLSRDADRKPVSLFGGHAAWTEEYIFNASALFIAGNLCYTFLTSGNALNGFYRYTMCVPCFYIVLFLLPSKIRHISPRYKMGVIGLCFAAMALFLYYVVYGGSRFRFEYLGLYLLLFFGVLLIAEPYLSSRKKWVALALSCLPALIWHAYLFNMYLCNGWIYT